MTYEKLNENLKIKWIENFNISNEKYTQVSGYIFNEKNQLLIVGDGKNWTIPGGHPENHESMIETLIREVLEESSIELKEISYLGAVEVVENGETYYQMRYFGRVSNILDFKGEWETSERMFVDLDELHNYIKWSKGVTFNAQIESSKKLLDK